MINKIKAILNILSNNIEKHCVEVWKYDKCQNPIIKEEHYTEWQIQFIKDNKNYSLSLMEKESKNIIYFSIFDKILNNRLGKPIEIEVPSDERTEIKLLFDKIILNSEKFVRNALNKLELL